MRRRTWAIICFVTLLGGCSIFDIGEDGGDELAEQREKWERNGPASYSFVLRRICMVCGAELGGPVLVEVTNGERTRTTYVEGGAAVSAENVALFTTIDGIFDFLEEAGREADNVDITWDSELGYPREIRIDYEENAIDDEFGLTVTSLTVR